MPITPNAPDYVGQVRGILNDLREDYARKQKLFLEEQAEKNRTELAFAQLAAQQRTADVQRSVNSARTIGGDAVNLAGFQKAQFDMADKAAARDLEERKFRFEQLKEINKLEEEKRQQNSEVEAGRLEGEGMVAYYSGDPRAIIEWSNKVQGAQLNLATRAGMIKNMNDMMASHKDLQSYLKNQEIFPKVQGLMTELSLLDPTKFDSSDSFRAAMTGIGDRFRSLGVTDLGLIKAYQDTELTQAQAWQKYKESKEIQDMTDFESRATRGLLAKTDPEAQKAWDDLHADARYQDSAGRASDTYREARTRIRVDHNVRNTEKTLLSEKERMRMMMDNLLRQNPELGVKQVDPATGEEYVTFPFPPPDMSPTVGENGAIDPTTGNLTKRKDEQIKAWFAEVTSPNFIKKPEEKDPLAEMLQMTLAERMGAPKGKPPVQGGEVAQAKPAPIRVMFPGEAPVSPRTVAAIPQTGPMQGETVAARTERPVADVTDYRKNEALLAEVDRQQKSGRATFENPIDKKDTGINLMTLRARILSRMGQRQVQTFGPQTTSMVEQILPPVSIEGPTE